MQDDAVNSVQQTYKTESHTRVGFGVDAQAAARSYAPFLKFVEHVAPPRPSSVPLSLLDVGCGCGWTSFCLANAGYNTTGIDLNSRGFEPPPIPGLSLVEGNALALPFAFVARRFDRMHRALSALCGVVSLGFGLFLVYDIGFLHGLFTGHPQWTPE